MCLNAQIPTHVEGINMKEKISKLYEYLINNNHTQDSYRVKKILDEYIQNADLSELSKKELTVMCNPKYLGDLYIKEFSDSYMWWNFLAEIKSELV